MNRDEILNMPAGPEINEMVWIYFFGKKPIPLEKAFCPYCLNGMRYCGTRSWCDVCEEWRYSPYQDYSDDIAAAWEVVEKMRDKSIAMTISTMGYKDDTNVITVYEGRKICKVYAPTAPLAICRAALLATMEIEE